MEQRRRKRALERSNLEGDVSSAASAGESPTRKSSRKSYASPDSGAGGGSSRAKKSKTKVKVETDESASDSDVNNHENDELDYVDDKGLVSLAHGDKGAELPDWPGWDHQDLATLIQRIEDSLPETDALKYMSRVDKLEWDKISFGSHSPDSCKRTWLSVQERVRRFRILKEVLTDAKAWLNKPWTNFYRGMKQNRHPDLPKRPLSTYMLFYMEKKDRVAKENPGIDMTQVSKIVAEMYKALSSKKKQKYAEKSAKMREEYQEKLDKFYEEHPEMNPKAAGTARGRSGHGTQNEGPARPQNPFMLFYNEKVEKHKSEPGFQRATLLAKCKEQWRQLSDRKRIKWIHAALAEQTKYDNEMKLYKETHPEYEIPLLRPILTKQEETLKDKLAGKPEKPPNSGYGLYSRMMLKNSKLKDVNSRERLQEISQLWKSLSEEERTEYNTRVQEMINKYKLEFATYLESLPADQRQAQLNSTTKKGSRKKKPATESPKKTKVSKPQPKPETENKGRKSSLFYFAQERLARYKKNHPSLSSDELSKLIARDFQALSSSQKEKYEKMANSDSKKKKPMNLFKNEPVPPPTSVYQLFLKTFMVDASHMSQQDRLKEAPRYYKILPESEKEKYLRRYEETKKKYVSDFDKFIKRLSPEELAEYTNFKKKRSANEEVESNSGQDENEDSNEQESESGGDESSSEAASATSSVNSDSSESEAESSSSDSDDD